MKDIFKEVMGIEGVRGLLIVSNGGGVTLAKSSPDFKSEAERLEKISWLPFMTEMGGIKDAELIYDSARFYIKKFEDGYLIVIIGDNAPISMVRLNCEVLLPSLSKMQPTSKKIGNLLRKKIF
ncbi:MAG: hypothetical protein C4518_15460 [Desulfobacteraceae bacterium]|nr:MAG: hypothetical protein C4518_15460 [Desulfobacteraceae bacterium]